MIPTELICSAISAAYLRSRATEVSCKKNRAHMVVETLTGFGALLAPGLRTQSAMSPLKICCRNVIRKEQVPGGRSTAGVVLCDEAPCDACCPQRRPPHDPPDHSTIACVMAGCNAVAVLI